MNFRLFNEIGFLPALKVLFKELKVPINYVADEPTTGKEILKDTYKDNETFQLMDDVFFMGMVDDAAFDGNASLATDKIKSDYDGILIFGITLQSRPNGLLPTRSQLAEISRAFNREYYYTPVVVVYKYGKYLAFANTERMKYKQEWREGEKAGKVSLLRDINIENPHSGHERILAELKLPPYGKNQVDSFDKLYNYWQEVFSVSILNKKFYQELSNWYFWATKHVAFPGEPTIVDAHKRNVKLEELQQEHRATNVIRMLTRLLFVWFIKEKKLIPEELFDLGSLQEDILNEISPYHETGLFKERNKESIYYKAILQNLFFATLNCPIEGDSLDKRKRGFRGDGYGTHRGIDYLMRYKSYFKNPDTFLKKLNDVVPFLNGGLFECLDDKFNNLYIDGFSDQMSKGEQLIVPDYLFFGIEEETDLSDIVGIKDKKYKQAAVKGLINILKSYKFTITENTPIEEDVALDPELLGKVFENLLASYNPETKTTARKQTGSFYTPREIVNYMVDESLIAYLKNAISDWRGLDDETLEKELHVLTSFDSKVPFAENPELQKEIISALSTCTILDPACGSGAFPMGILQKMVHILQKFDPDNKVWKEVQLAKAEQDSKAAFEIEDKQARKERLLEINEAFDQSINDPDYARKLFLIENCIYGVDIQPIATQISKLRFFISLVVEQIVNANKDNFGIRPLPNLETKFVAANTLIGIKKDGILFETDEVKRLEAELKIVRHKSFSLKSKERKIAWREKDKELREKLSAVLKNQGLPLDAAEKLAKWDPYDQNEYSKFFDPEWMFGIKEGFDIILANPPYIGHKGGVKNLFRELKSTSLGKSFNNERMDIFYYFFHIAINIAGSRGIISFITTNYFPTADSAVKLRADIYKRTFPFIFVDFNELTLFESARGQHNLLTFLSKNKISNTIKVLNIDSKYSKSEREIKYLLSGDAYETTVTYLPLDNYRDNESGYFLIKGLSQGSNVINDIIERISIISDRTLGEEYNLSQGVVTGIDKISPKHVRKSDKYYKNLGEGVFVVSKEVSDSFDHADQVLLKPWFKNSDISKFHVNENTENFLIHTYADLKIKYYPSIEAHLIRFYDAITSRNYESGELSKANKLGAWYALSSSRKEFDFSAPKIVSPQRSLKNTFAYTNTVWCASADVYFITAGAQSSIPLEALLIILNSKLFYLWLYYRGKRKGEMLELYLTPLSAIPLPRLTIGQIKLFSIIGKITTTAFSILKIGPEIFEKVADAIVTEIYFLDHMKERGIAVLDVVERDINEVIQGRDFEKLSDTEIEKVIETLHAKWSHPDNEVRNRIKLFAVRSPEILKPILES